MYHVAKSAEEKNKMMSYMNGFRSEPTEPDPIIFFPTLYPELLVFPAVTPKKSFHRFLCYSGISTRRPYDSSTSHTEAHIPGDNKSIPGAIIGKRGASKQTQAAQEGWRERRPPQKSHDRVISGKLPEAIKAKRGPPRS